MVIFDASSIDELRVAFRARRWHDAVAHGSARAFKPLSVRCNKQEDCVSAGPRRTRRLEVHQDGDKPVNVKLRS